MEWLNRWLSWYVPPQTQIRVTIPVENSIIGSAEGGDGQDFFANITIVKDLPLRQRYSTVLLRQAKLRHTAIALYRFEGKLQIVDRNFWDVEESLAFERLFRAHRTERLESLRARLAEVTIKNYSQLYQLCKKSENAFVFGTGPSLRQALDRQFSDDELTIVCNSIVKDEELLAHIKPKVLTFADQVFHFGPSEYAETFRRDALQVVQDYQCKCIVPIDRAILLALHYPEVVDHLIAMPFGTQLNFPTPDLLYVEPTENIMTLFMIPVASALAKNVYFIGADGRAPKERYFWRYDRNAQYQSLLPNVAEWHPSFFLDRNIASYYKKHCKKLEQQLRYGESQGLRYKSLTTSYIPALAQRHGGEEQSFFI